LPPSDNSTATAAVVVIIIIKQHSRTELIYWSFIQHCYMFRLFTSAIISSLQFTKRM